MLGLSDVILNMVLRKYRNSVHTHTHENTQIPEQSVQTPDSVFILIPDLDRGCWRVGTHTHTHTRLNLNHFNLRRHLTMKTEECKQTKGCCCCCRAVMQPHGNSLHPVISCRTSACTEPPFTRCWERLRFLRACERPTARDRQPGRGALEPWRCWETLAEDASALLAER